jgi:hypothetical protein
MKLIEKTDFTLDDEKIKRYEKTISGLKLLSIAIMRFDVFKALFGKSSNTVVHLTTRDEREEQCEQLKKLAISMINITP